MTIAGEIFRVMTLYTKKGEPVEQIIVNPQDFSELIQERSFLGMESLSVNQPVASVGKIFGINIFVSPSVPKGSVWVNWQSIREWNPSSRYWYEGDNIGK